MSRATRCGLFEADLSAGELRKQGRLIRVPLSALTAVVVLLLTHTGTVTRSESNSSSANRAVAAEASLPPGTVDAGALDDYRRGRIAMSRRTEEGLRSGIELFGRALALDPRYASAHVGLADAWSLLASYGMEEPRSALQRARDHATRALQLNPGQADAHTSLGRTTMIGNWD